MTRRSGRGETWTVVAVKQVRGFPKIAHVAPDRPRIQALPDQFPDGRHSISGAAKKLHFSVSVVRR